ncbi:MAG: sialate O-acetylesterase [Cytophagales bacterium]|nr:sialate O-acetylesterase [Cytophagales bacterium]
MLRWTILLLLLGSTLAQAEIRLPRLISNGAVLQRDRELTIWGWADAGEEVTLALAGKSYVAIANPKGEWAIKLSPQPAGGPYPISLRGKNELVLTDILFGDVWVCSGQSNMELTMERVKEKYAKEIAAAENKFIRQFLVADKYDFKNEHQDLDNGNWIAATPTTVLDFSAVAYFFAVALNQKHQVPIGLINAALGGSPAEAWMSEEALRTFPSAFEELQKFKSDALISEITTADRARITKWYSDLNRADAGLKKWMLPGNYEADWKPMNVPGYWADAALGNLNGSVWFKKTVTIPPHLAGKPGALWMGRIVDADSVFINGKLVGTTSYQYPPRRYSFGSAVLQPGTNEITVRVINNSGRGGFVADKPYFLAVESDTIDLKGLWKYRQGAAMPPLQGETFIRWKPGGLYNHMIAPLVKYSITGVIWYQGESNTSNAKEYEQLFAALIADWRSHWHQGNFPFLFVQLANFMESRNLPQESNWAALRQAQAKTLRVPNTAMAVAIDLGEWNDIHPLNKADVGKRLALAAEHVAYGNPAVGYSGPLYKSHSIRQNKITIEFDQVGAGLVSKGGDLKQFAIAGANRKFVWAKARIINNKVEVWSEAVPKPVAVRYAWADNPEGANLYNLEGLPASPFEIPH